MNWLRALAKPISLKDGRNIETLAAARSFMPTLPDYAQRQAIWHDVGELLAEAAADETWMRDVEIQLNQVLATEGLIERFESK